MTTRLRSALRLPTFAVAVVATLLVSHGQAAAAGQEPSALAVAAPATATLGQKVTVQARLVGANGPIVKAAIQFVVPATFLNTAGDMLVGIGTTDGDGLATAEFEARMTGALQVKAVFRGDTTYAASTASAPVSISGSNQLYVPDIGIRLRGLNTTPIGQEGTAGHWLLTGWPIGALLVLIWSTYAVAVFFMSRISAEADHATEAMR
jgi:hypothetical protein